MTNPNEAAHDPATGVAPEGVTAVGEATLSDAPLEGAQDFSTPTGTADVVDTKATHGYVPEIDALIFPYPGDGIAHYDSSTGKTYEVVPVVTKDVKDSAKGYSASHAVGIYGLDGKPVSAK